MIAEQPNLDNQDSSDKAYGKVLADFDPYLYKDDAPWDDPKPFIKIEGEVVSSFGNLLALTGLQKTGKTGVCGAITSACLTADNRSIDTLGMEIAPNIDGKGVIYVSTELSTADFRKLTRKILERAGLERMPEFFYALNFSSLKASDLLEKTKEFIEGIGRSKGIQLIVIDGIADYVDSVNDLTDSTNVVKDLMAIARKFQAVAVTVIHKNSGSLSDKARGHIGSEISRKSEGTLDLTRERDIVAIKGKSLRNGSDSFPPRLMQFDLAKGYFVYKGIGMDKEEKDEVKAKKRRSTLEAIFQGNDPIPYKDFILAIMVSFKVKDSRAKKMRTEFVREGLIMKNENGSYSLISPM